MIAKQLVIPCDDAGLSKGINHAIAELAAEGMVTSANVLPNIDLYSWMCLRLLQALIETLQSLSGIVEIVVRPGVPNDPTYPSDWALVPEDRQRQYLFLKEVMTIFRNTETGFTLSDSL